MTRHHVFAPDGTVRAVETHERRRRQRCICGAYAVDVCGFRHRDGKLCALPICDQHRTGDCCPEHAKGMTP